MRTIIAGSRQFGTVEVEQAMAACPWRPTFVLSGGARGVDRAGERWARRQGIPYKVYAAHWEEYGKAAGFMRNREMAVSAEALVAIWDGESRGTADMIDVAESRHLRVFVWWVKKKEGDR